MAEKKRVLVVDDETDARDFVKAVLEDDFEILMAANGDEALKVASAKSPDLILLDVQMPGQSGFDVFIALRKEEGLAKIPVIMLTGVREKAGIGFSKKEMGDYFGEEPNAYLEKPIDPGKLSETVKRVLGESCCGCGE